MGNETDRDEKGKTPENSYAPGIDKNTAIFSTLEAPFFEIQLSNELTLKAENGVLRCTKDEAQMVENLMRKRPDIRARLKRIDLDQAAAMVKKHRTESRSAASQGAFNSAQGTRAQQNKQAQTTENLTGSSNPAGVFGEGEPKEDVTFTDVSQPVDQNNPELSGAANSSPEAASHAASSGAGNSGSVRERLASSGKANVTGPDGGKVQQGQAESKHRG